MAHLSDLKQDGRNARRHSPRNLAMIEESIQRNGFGRSILLANDGTIIAGNATYESCASAGFEGVQVPVTASWNVDLLRSAGFRQIECYWRWCNFAAWVGVK